MSDSSGGGGGGDTPEDVHEANQESRQTVDMVSMDPNDVVKFATQYWDQSGETASWKPRISRDSHPGNEPGTIRPGINKRKGRRRNNQVRYCPQQFVIQRQTQGPTLWSSWSAKTPLKCLILFMLLVLCRSTIYPMLNSNLPAHKGHGCYLEPQPRLTPSWTHPLPGRWDGKHTAEPPVPLGSYPQSALRYQCPGNP